MYKRQGLFFLIPKGYKNLKYTLLLDLISEFMRVKLEPETAFVGKKFGWIFFGVIFSLNALFFIWFFFFSNLTYLIFFA